MRYASKRELLERITGEHDRLCTRLQAIPLERYREPGVWGDRWTVHDLVAHLAEWHAMFLRWLDDGRNGRSPALPAPGFKWNETPALNRAIWEKHRGRPWHDVWADFSSTYDRILVFVEGTDEEDLLRPGRWAWTGTHPLTTYLGPNTASHYRFAIKVLDRWLKGRVRRR